MSSRRRVIAAAIAFVVLLPACQVVRINWNTITRVDAPLSMRPDERLSMESPDPEEEVRVPLTVRWSSKDWDLTNGNQFGVFLDTAIPRPDETVRVRLCTRLGELPPAPGDIRAICTDQREQIRFTKKHSMTFDCLEPFFNRGKRRMHDHRVSVILLDKNLKRVGEAAADVAFSANADDVRKCRGFED